MKNWKTSAEQILTTGPVVPVIVVNKLEHAVPMAKALVAGGVRAFTTRERPNYEVDLAALRRQAVRDGAWGFDESGDALEMEITVAG